MVRAQHHVPPKMHCCILRLKPTNFMGPWYHFFWGQRQMASNYYNIVEQNIHGRWTSDRWSLITDHRANLAAPDSCASQPGCDVHGFQAMDKTKRIQGPWTLLGMFRSESKKDGCQKQRQHEQTSWRELWSGMEGLTSSQSSAKFDPDHSCLS